MLLEKMAEMIHRCCRLILCPSSGKSSKSDIAIKQPSLICNISCNGNNQRYSGIAALVEIIKQNLTKPLLPHGISSCHPNQCNMAVKIYV